MSIDPTVRDETTETYAVALRAQEARIRHMILWHYLDLRDSHETHRLGVPCDDDLRHRRGYREDWSRG